MTDKIKKTDQKKNKVTVEIFGNAYSLRGHAEPERITRLANLVDEKMEMTAKANPRLPPIKVAVLVALNLADEYLRLESDYAALMDMVKNEKNS